MHIHWEIRWTRIWRLVNEADFILSGKHFRRCKVRYLITEGEQNKQVPLYKYRHMHLIEKRERMKDE
jgi:hypothetical protein